MALTAAASGCTRQRGEKVATIVHPPFSLDMKYVAAKLSVIAERHRLFKSQKYSHFPGWNVQLFVNADHKGPNLDVV